MNNFVNQRLVSAAQKADDRARVAEASALSTAKRFSRFRTKHRLLAQALHRDCFLALMSALHGAPPKFHHHVWPPPEAPQKPPPFVGERFANLELE